MENNENIDDLANDLENKLKIAFEQLEQDQGMNI
jgi:hypothetical protein